MKRVIITGANGFLGKSLVKALHNRGYQITALSRNFDIEIQAPARCIQVRDMSINDIKNILHGHQYDCFYNFAWSGTSGMIRGDYTTQIENIRLTCEYVELASSLHCPRFIYASSINEIETYDYMRTDDIKPSRAYIYGAAKLGAHLIAEALAYSLGVGFIPVIISNIYGIGDVSARLVYTSIKKLILGEHCSFTEGKQNYDFVYITDAINSIIEVGEKGKAFNNYYIGNGEPKALKEFLIKIRDIVAPNVDIGLGDIPFNGISVDYSQFDLKKVERDTGYENKVSFEEGISMTYEWLKDRLQHS